MITAILVMSFLAADVEAPVFSAGNDELRQYIVEATENNPGLKAKHLEWQAALQKVPQVTALDDPMFMYTQFLQSDETRFGLSLEQKFPWFGTLRVRGDKAMAEADAALSRFYAARNEVVAGLKRAYFEYALLGESITIIQSQTETLTDVEELVKSRYELGLVSQTDLYRVQIERDKLDDMRKGLEQSKPARAALLLEALGRDLEGDLPWPQPAAFPPPPPPPAEVLARIRTANPDIDALQHMAESWEKEAILARKRGYPEFSVGLGYEDMKSMRSNNRKMDTAMAGDAAKMFLEDAPMNGVVSTLGEIAYEVGRDRYLRESTDTNDDIMVSLKLSLPIWRGRIKAGIREARLMQASVEHERRRATLSFDSAAHTTLFNIQDALRRFNLYKEVLIPKESHVYDNLQAYYATGIDPVILGGTADFLDILNSINALLEYQLEQARATRDIHVAWSDLEMLMGGPWTGTDPESRPKTEDTEGGTTGR